MSGYSQLNADASLRIADSYYVLKEYSSAITWYDNAVGMNMEDMDYALYQKSINLGVLLRYEEKIETLNHLIDKFPNSPFVTDALFQLGETYLQQKQNEKALIAFKTIVNDYPNSAYVAESILRTGLIYYNSDQTELALITYKKVVTRYPATSHSKEALVSIRNLYVEMNNVDEFFKYVQDLSFADVSAAEQDSLTFIAAENQYINGSCNNALDAFDDYLKNYPEGLYAVQANYYSAECYAKTENTVEAIGHYKAVIEKPRSVYTVKALLKASRILFEEGNYEDAYGYFYELEQSAEDKNQLMEARYGQMKCNFVLEKYDNAVNTADKLLATEKVSEERKTDALLIKAKSFIALDEFNKATDVFSEIITSTKGAAAAESKYNLAKISYINGDLETAEKEVFELINNFPQFDYWMANGFILLTDIYIQTGNIFQAKQTLQSIIDNYEGPELGELAEKKLQAIIKEEELQKNKQQIKSDTLEDNIIELQIENDTIRIEDF